MKIKTILGAAVTVCATLIMSMVVSAATDIKAEGISMNSSGYVVVPIVITTTDMDNLSAYDISVNYDSDKYTYARLVDTLTYEDEWGDDVSYGSLSTSNDNNKNGVVTFNWYMNNSDLKFPEPDDNNKIELARIWFTTSSSNYSANDFTVKVTEIGNQNENKWNAENMNSFFTFDVTGDLGGNLITSLYASTDGGETKQELNYYTTTNWEDGMDYAEATTTFLVAVDTDTDAVINITIYGKIGDSDDYIPLTSFDQNDFLVQDFE